MDALDGRPSLIVRGTSLPDWFLQETPLKSGPRYIAVPAVRSSKGGTVTIDGYDRISVRGAM